MRSVQVASRLRKPALRRLAHVEMAFSDARLGRGAGRDERRVAYAVIELQNTWMEFARALFLTYALGGRDPSGTWVKHGLAQVVGPQDAIREAAHLFLPKNRRRPKVGRRDEPVWHQRTTLTRLVSHFGFSNSAHLMAGLSVQTKVFDFLPPMRNFYAHKNSDTSGSARRMATHYRLGQTGHPTDLLLASAPNRPQSVAEDWVSDFRDIIEALT